VDERFSQIDGRTRIGWWVHLGNVQTEQLLEHPRAVHRTEQEGGSLANPAGLATDRAHT